MWYGLLADLIVAIHVAYMGYVLVGQALILVGAPLHWRWIRNPWFRWTHLGAILIVAFEAIWGIACPLTTWENELRAAAGGEVSPGTFVGRFLDAILFYDVEQWILNWCYIGFAVLVLGTLLLVPPRRLRAGPPSRSRSG
jgi:hypothetical protein